MSLYGALFAGVSGLASQSSAMGAIADNVTNINTIGYKGTTVNFNTLVTKQVSSTKYSPGGVQSAPRTNVDLQGLLQATTSSTDVGISGGGFFVVSDQAKDSSGFAYTRAGSFKVDKDGYMKNVGGYYMQGWPLDNWDGTATAAQVNVDGNLYMKSYKNSSGDTYYMNDNAVDSTNLQPLNLQTIGGTARATSSLAIGANLPGGTSVSVGTTAKTNALIFDTLGNSHNLNLTWMKRAQNSWDFEAVPPEGSKFVAIGDQSSVHNTYMAAGRMDFSEVPASGSSLGLTVGGTAYTFNFGTTTANLPEVATANSGSLAGWTDTVTNQGDTIDINGVTFTLTTTATSATDIDVTGLTTAAEVTDRLINTAEAYFDTTYGPGNYMTTGAAVTGFQSVFVVGNATGAGGVAAAGNADNNGGVLGANAFSIDIQGKSLSQVLDLLGRQVNTAMTLEFGAPNAPPGTWGGRISGENAITFRQGSTTDTLDVDASNMVDSAGAAVVMQTGTWEVPVVSAAVNANNANLHGVTFSGDGSVDTIMGKNETDEPDPRLQISIGWANGAADMDGSESAAISMFLGNYNSKDGLQQLAGDYQLNYISQNGNKFGNFAGVSIGEDGIVTALFDNGVTTPIFMIPIASFVNPNGMSSLTGNVFQQTDVSGLPTVREAGTAGAGTVAGAALESSTVDLGEEFTHMITTQRAYSAAAKIITTADEMLDELVRIKR
jgi:flagellar hook protein FlgE